MCWYALHNEGGKGVRGPALLPPGGRPRDSTRLGSAERPGRGRGSQASDLTGDGAGARCNISAKWTPVCHRRGRKILTILQENERGV